MKMIIMDTETGGINHETDALLAIGAIVVEKSLSGFTKLGTYSAFINPDSTLKIEATALAINKLSLDFLDAEGVPERQAIMGLIKFASQYRNKMQFPIPVGWNLHFDRSFLTAAMKRHNVSWPFYFIELDVAHYWKHYNLFDNNRVAFGGIREAAWDILKQKVEHTAIGDVELTLRLLSEFTGVPIVATDEGLSTVSG